MYVSTEIYHDVVGPFADDRDGVRFAELRQSLDAFLEGAEFSVAEDPYAKPGDAMLARVAPVNDEIWDLRVIVPKPGIRVLGRFVVQDSFVALTWEYRENLDEPGLWEAEVERFKDAWQALFGTREPPFKGVSLDDYLTTCYPV